MLIVMVPILIHKDVSEPIYNDLKFTVQNHNYFFTNLRLIYFISTCAVNTKVTATTFALESQLSFEASKKRENSQILVSNNILQKQAKVPQRNA